MAFEVPPYALAAADQLRAAAARHATVDELRSSTLRWAHGVAGFRVAETFDGALSDLALALGTQCELRPWALTDAFGVELDPSDALVTRPHLHGYIVPMTMLEHLDAGERGLAREVWALLHVANISDSGVRQFRLTLALDAVALLTRYAHHSNREVRA